MSEWGGGEWGEGGGHAFFGWVGVCVCVHISTFAGEDWRAAGGRGMGEVGVVEHFV